ncbi:MAG: hypothetical protein KGI04_03065 [Candidatus Micrarchaeota archaeon]|nr:hypothetical protein [Candidatus Micrarchaeota archaeon]
MEVLECGCRIDEGVFIVGSNCTYCKECNAVAQMHPFGDKRLADFVKER